MNKILLIGLISIVSFRMHAAEIGVYDCILKNSTEKASLVYWPEFFSITWMPDLNLKTTKSNAMGQLLDSGETQFILFGFQDQSDLLILPKNLQSLPRLMDIYTYHDNDDVAEDVQNFTCSRF